MKLCQLAFGQSFSVTCNAETGFKGVQSGVHGRESIVEGLGLRVWGIRV
jgi:hypothetical protein